MRDAEPTRAKPSADTHFIIFVLDARETYSEEADCCDDAPVLGACEALDRALRKAGLRDGAALSVQLFRSHDDVD